MANRPAAMADRRTGKEIETMRIMMITAKQDALLRLPRFAIAICGVLLVGLLAQAGHARAAEQSWLVSQAVPAQVFPESNFEQGIELVKQGTTPTSEALSFHIDFPAGFRYFKKSKGPSNVPCTPQEDQLAIDCTVPAGTPPGKRVVVGYVLHVEPDATVGQRRFHLEFSGGAGAAPPPPADSQPVEVIATERPFGIAELDGVNLNEDGSAYTQAGGHPWANSTTIRFNTSLGSDGLVAPADGVKDITVDLPAGYLGNPEATPKCRADQLSTFSGGGVGEITIADCPTDSQVGTVALELSAGLYRVPVFNIEPQGNAPAQFGFNAVGTVVTFFPEVRPDDSGIRAKFKNISQTFKLFGSTLTLWGSPTDSTHDDLRGSCGGFAGQFSPGSGCPRKSAIPPVGFYVNPTSCLGPLTTAFAVTSWQGGSDTGQFTSHDGSGNPQGMTGCDRVPFDPKMTARQTTESADSPSGLNFKLSVPEAGILNPQGVSQAHLRKAVVKLPEGVTLNPSAAEGLGTCSPAQYASETLLTEFGGGCPGTSKLGSVQISSPVLPDSEQLKGDLFIASPYDNPSNSLIALYMVVRDVDRGIIVKAAGKVEPDPRTGQIVSTFDNLPQLPFGVFELRFREGGRAPLTTPSTCGTHTTEAELTPWSAKANPAPSEITHLQSSYQITHGVGGGPCPAAGVPPFNPHFEAGSVNNNAKSYSPFYMRLTRADGEQSLTKFSSVLPPGVIGKLAGVSKCSDPAIAAARLKTGTVERAIPSCPANSQIGRIVAGAGVGSVLTYVPGKVYLGGPYKGDPLSVVVITPAVAGPFDVGNVVTRVALTVNPKTAEVQIDGAASDPIPHILAGIPLRLRDLRVYVDRDKFILNPTSCDPSSVRATLFGSGVDVFNPADDEPVDLSTRYQAANCEGLGFKPKLSLTLKGGTKRGSHPALTGIFRPRPGDANLSKLTLRLPHSAFLEQAHIRTICTRVQFAADACPKGAIYGHATAYTPLLDYPLEGPVYLRSSSHDLPDFVADLHGLVDVEVAARIDSSNGGIRATFSDLPDTPLTKVVVQMQGGKKGLIVNSTNLCASPHHANVQMDAQNGKRAEEKPVVGIKCGGKKSPRRQSSRR
jgi:hypothetical protein